VIGGATLSLDSGTCGGVGVDDSPFSLKIQALDLICRHDLNLWFPVAKSDYACDADDFPLDHVKSLIPRYRGPGCNESGEGLIGVFSSEIDKCGPQWAGRHKDNPAAHLDIFADMLKGFRVFYHYWLVRTRYNRTNKQGENRE
jgi:hypothetical protein